MGDIHGNNLHTLVHSQNRGVAVGVDFHYNLHRIFWTDTIQNKVIFTPAYYPVFSFTLMDTWEHYARKAIYEE